MPAGVGAARFGCGGLLLLGGHLVEHGDEGVEGVPLVDGEEGDGGGAAGEECPGPPGGVGCAVGGGDDDESAFPAGFGEDFDGVVGVVAKLGEGRRAAGEFEVAPGGAVDAVQPVEAAGGGGFEVAGVESCPEFRLAVIGHEFGGELLDEAFGDGAAFEFEDFEVAADLAADDADAGAGDGGDFVASGALGLAVFPRAGRHLGAVGADGDDAAAVVVEGERRLGDGHWLVPSGY